MACWKGGKAGLHDAGQPLPVFSGMGERFENALPAGGIIKQLIAVKQKAACFLRGAGGAKRRFFGAMLAAKVQKNRGRHTAQTACDNSEHHAVIDIGQHKHYTHQDGTALGDLL